MRRKLKPGRKTALEAAITPLRAYQIWWTLVHKRRNIRLRFRPTQSTFSDAHISAHISGLRALPPKILQLVEGEQRLLVHTSLGMDLPQQFFNAWQSKIGQKSGVLWLISSGLVGGIAPNFRTWCVPLGHKMSVSDFGVLLPKKSWAEKRVFHNAILRLYCRYLQTGTRYRLVENGAAA